MASPRSVGSILMTSAPQSASSAEAAGTKVCSATSRTRTPSITAVTGTLPLSARLRRRVRTVLESNSDIDVDNSPAPRGPPPRAPSRASARPGATCSRTLPTARPVGHVAQGGRRVGQVERGPDERHGAALGQQVQQLARRCGPCSAGWCMAKSRNWNPRMRMPFSSTRLSGMRGIVPDGVAHGHEAAAVVQRAQGRLGQVAADRVDDDVGPVRAAPRAGPGAGRRRGGR